MHQKFTSLQDLLDYIRQTNGNEPKGIYEMGKLPVQLVARIRDTIGVNTEGLQLTLDNFGIRHAFAGHSQARGSQDQHPLTESDILALPGWIFDPETLSKGAPNSSPSQPLRLLLKYLNAQQQVRTIVILEVRPRYRRLVLVTMYKVQNKNG